MADLSWIGIWLLVIGVVLIVVELALAGIWSMRIGRRSQLLSQRLVEEQRLIRADLERLRVALAEMRELWRPYRRLVRILRHPLMIALMQSYVRRRSL